MEMASFNIYYHCRAWMKSDQMVIVRVGITNTGFILKSVASSLRVYMQRIYRI